MDAEYVARTIAKIRQQTQAVLDTRLDEVQRFLLAHREPHPGGGIVAAVEITIRCAEYGPSCEDKAAAVGALMVPAAARILDPARRTN